jgi:hypothetical protein
MGLLDRITRGELKTTAALPLASQSTRGLLGKASSLLVEDADAEETFEAAFVQRVRRLPIIDSTPYTALSLLKAFHPFSAGLCLTLREDNYECVTSIGVEIAAESIPMASLFPPSDLGPHSIGAAGDYGIASATPETEAWVFPVAPAQAPYSAALILVEEPGKPLSLPTLSRVITACAEQFAPLSQPRKDAGAGIKEILASTLKKFPCQLIVLERGSGGLAKEAGAAMASLGSAIALSEERTLIAIPPGHDRELLAHRLAKSLQAVTVAVAEVSSMDAAQEFLKTLR